MDLNTSIDKLPKTSFLTIKKFKSLKINTFFDLLNYFPFRYENYSLISKIKDLQEGEQVTITGKIIDVKNQISKKGLKIQIFRLEDDTGVIDISFYNQPYLLNLFKINTIASFSGIVERFGRKITLNPKEFELGEPLKHTGKIIPIYEEKKGLSSRTIREKIFFILSLIKNENFNLKEILPKKIIDYNHLLDEVLSYKEIHYPSSFANLEKAKKRLAFDELFLIQLSSFLVKKSWEKETVSNKFEVKKYESKINDLIKTLPFELTQSQKKVLKEIFSDLEKEKPMNRFLQGEVGSGKTVVACLTCYLSFLNGYQSLVMAPTEILAQQHYQSFLKFFANKKIKIGLATSSKKKDLDADIIIGTHALISKKITFEKVGLVIIDEQHRFGVNQRALLKKKGKNPHLLTMTATPIPRTVALTLYGELDMSVIDQMPKGRKPIKTFYVPKIKRNSCYQWIKNEIKKHKSQVFVICPLIEESEVETLKSIKAAKTEFENLKKIFSDFKLALLHGKMKTKEKDKIMIDFKNGLFDILVSTPVVEVGIDIPNATIMLIEAAERFGLAQLHQLRGRVGRGEKQSYCFLFSEKEDEKIIKKLKLFASTLDGIKLAEEDLKIRGPGDIFGTKQHGYIDLKIASLSDYQMIEKTKNALDFFVKNYSLDNFLDLKLRLKYYQKGEIAKD